MNFTHLLPLLLLAACSRAPDVASTPAEQPAVTAPSSSVTPSPVVVPHLHSKLVGEWELEQHSLFWEGPEKDRFLVTAEDRRVCLNNNFRFFETFASNGSWDAHGASHDRHNHEWGTWKIEHETDGLCVIAIEGKREHLGYGGDVHKSPCPSEFVRVRAFLFESPERMVEVSGDAAGSGYLRLAAR